VTEQPARARDRGVGVVGEHDAAEPAGAPARPASAEFLRVLAWAAAYAAASWYGQHTVIGGSGFALFWPASGVALAWIATTRPRLRPLELGLVGTLAAGAAYSTDQTSWGVLNALVGVPLGLAVFVAVSRRWVPRLCGTGGTGEIETLRQYGLLLGAALLAGLTETAVAVAVLSPEPGLPFERVAELAITHTIAMAAVGVTLLVICGWWAALPGTRLADRVTAVRGSIGSDDLLLSLAGTAVTVLVFLAGFVWFADAPVSFVLVMAVVAVGLRYGATATGLYALTITVAACWLTAEGNGPIAVIPEPHRRALAFGLFMTAVVLTGLTIALSRRERDATIVQLRESERAAEVLADDLSLVLANLEEGVAVIEEGGRFIHANAAIGRLLELPDFNDERTEPVGTYHLVHPDGRPLLESEVPHVRAFAGEEDVRDVLHLARPDVHGERIFEVSARVLPQIRSTDPPRAVTTIRDATDEHLQRDALTSFAQVVAHDLRSPLTSVELWARELLDSYQDGPVDADTATMMLRHVESAAGRMQNFISDLLAYALARDQTPSPIRVELTDVVDSVVETIAALEGTLPEVLYSDLPGVWCDPVLVPQLFDNLIGNARKYVAEGVVPEVRIEATPLPGDWARVRVIDNGIGIAPEDRARVFETFQRARATEYEGTGLGLAICRHIVERHGGTIGVAAAPSGSGTCIELTLPMTDEAFDRATAHSFD
jgi:signal transduction histidine kinase